MCRAVSAARAASGARLSETGGVRGTASAAPQRWQMNTDPNWPVCRIPIGTAQSGQTRRAGRFRGAPRLSIGIIVPNVSAEVGRRIMRVLFRSGTRPSPGTGGRHRPRRTVRGVPSPCGSRKSGRYESATDSAAAECYPTMCLGRSVRSLPPGSCVSTPNLSAHGLSRDCHAILRSLAPLCEPGMLNFTS